MNPLFGQNTDNTKILVGLSQFFTFPSNFRSVNFLILSPLNSQFLLSPINRSPLEFSKNKSLPLNLIPLIHSLFFYFSLYYRKSCQNPTSFNHLWWLFQPSSAQKKNLNIPHSSYSCIRSKLALQSLLPTKTDSHKWWILSSKMQFYFCWNLQKKLFSDVIFFFIRIRLSVSFLELLGTDFFCLFKQLF